MSRKKGRKKAPSVSTNNILTKSSPWRSILGNQFLLSTIGGLLSSSCCVIQLALNLFSIGCAGFSILDPYRPFFLVATFTSLIASQLYLHRSFYSFLELRFIFLIALASTLVISPAIVQHLNDKNNYAHNNDDDDGRVMMIKVEIEGVKCEACRNRAMGALKALDGVTGCRVTKKDCDEDADGESTTHIAEIYLRSPNAVSDSQIEEALRAARFDARIIDRRYDDQ